MAILHSQQGLALIQTDETKYEEQLNIPIQIFWITRLMLTWEHNRQATTFAMRYDLIAPIDGLSSLSPTASLLTSMDLAPRGSISKRQCLTQTVSFILDWVYK